MNRVRVVRLVSAISTRIIVSATVWVKVPVEHDSDPT